MYRSQTQRPLGIIINGGKYMYRVMASYLKLFVINLYLLINSYTLIHTYDHILIEDVQFILIEHSRV